jgi:hypothetical protein
MLRLTESGSTKAIKQNRSHGKASTQLLLMAAFLSTAVVVVCCYYCCEHCLLPMLLTLPLPQVPSFPMT